MFIRKFYEADVADAGGGEAAVVEMSAAEAMAKMGSKSDESGKIPDPIDIQVKKDEPKVEEKTPEVATTKEEPKTEEPPEPEKKEPVVEAKVEEKAPIVQEATKPQTLDEVLKNNQPEAIFKALGFDDEKAELVSKIKDIDPKVVGIIQAYEKGLLGDYVKELATDYSKMEPEDVMRHQLRLDYPKANAKQLEILYKKEIVEAYNLDSDDETEVAEGRELLAAKADRYRDSFIANQDKYLMPEKPEPKTEPVADNTAEIQAKENVENYVRKLTEDPYTKDIVANKKITLGEGDEKFSYPVDPNSLISVLSDGKEWAATMFDEETGALKTQHQFLIAAVAKHGMDFLNAYGLHFKGLGAKEVVEPIENASKPDNSSPAKSDPLPTSAAALMAKQGKRSG